MVERIRPLVERSGEDAASVILRAIGLGIAGDARSDLGEPVWCEGMPGTIEALPEPRTYRVTLDPKWAALAARNGASLSKPNEKPFTAADTVCSALVDGICDLERHWFGRFDSWESQLADLIEQRPWN